MLSLSVEKRVSPSTGLLVLVTLYALVLSFSGTVFDHHYAERQTNHKHIYLGRITPNHIHPYETPHTHFYTQIADSESPSYAPPSDKVSNEIVYRYSYDRMGQVFTTLTIPPIHLAPISPEPEDNHFAFDTPRDKIIFQKAFITPPKKPPRV